MILSGCPEETNETEPPIRCRKVEHEDQKWWMLKRLGQQTGNLITVYVVFGIEAV